MSESLEKVLAERGKNYGRFKDHAAISQRFKRTVNLYHGDKLSSVHREALDMILHKIARIVNGNPNHVESWVDIAGYAQLVVNDLEGKA